MLMGLIEPTSGTARRARPAHAAAPPARCCRRVGALIEGPALYGFLSGRDNLLRYDAADPTADPRTRRGPGRGGAGPGGADRGRRARRRGRTRWA